MTNTKPTALDSLTRPTNPFEVAQALHDDLHAVLDEPATATAHTIQCRHASGSSEWEPEPECVGLSRDEAERVLATLEPTDEDGAALEYRIVQD